MRKNVLLRKGLLLSGLFFYFTLSAQQLPDSIIMTVAGKPIPVEEFQFIAGKNNELDFSDQDALRQYLDLFKAFKLKVAHAEAQGLDKTREFTQEYNTYRNQLISGYLSDRAGEEAYARLIYDRRKEILEISQIVFPLPRKVTSKDTLRVYNQALEIYQRIANGESFEKVGEELAEAHQALHHHDTGEHSHDHHDGHIHANYQHINGFTAMTAVKAFENAVYSLQPGEISHPVRTLYGYHIFKLHSRRPNPGIVQVAHIMIEHPKETGDAESSDASKKIEDIYNKLVEGTSFAELAEQFSEDKTAGSGGVLPAFGAGQVERTVEETVFSLQNPGDYCRPVKSSRGYHIFQLLKKENIKSFEEEKGFILAQLSTGEHNFEVHEAFVERMKKEHDYQFYPEAYAELLQLCDDYFPTDDEYQDLAMNMEKPLVRIGGTDILQNEFAYYMYRSPISSKTYGGDFMEEIYNIFIRDILRNLEGEQLETKYPEIPYLLQEYRDGILLFEISSKEVWDKPLAEQEAAEKEWISRLENTYPVEVNWTFMEKLKN